MFKELHVNLQSVLGGNEDGVNTKCHKERHQVLRYFTFFFNDKQSFACFFTTKLLRSLLPF